MAGNRFENRSCHRIRNKRNEDMKYDLKKLFNAKLTQLINKETEKEKREGTKDSLKYIYQNLF